MSRLTLRLTIALFTFIAGVTLSALWITSRPQLAPQSKLTAEGRPKKDEAETISFNNGRVNYKGISFTYDAELTAEVRARTIPASPTLPSSVVAVPGDVIFPEHITFSLIGAVLLPHAEVRVYPVVEYKHAFSTLPEMAKEVDGTIQRLSFLLQTQPVAFAGEVPYLPLPHGYFAFRAHTKYVKFKNGKGIVFLTQGQQDEALINNSKLSYRFQGLTDDGLYYVSATFRAKAPFLPDGDATSFEGYTPPDCFACENREELLRGYRRYVNKMRFRLEKVPPTNFQPNLKLYDTLISSLEIRR